MRPWLLMLSGLIVWLTHFLGLYALTSLDDLVDGKAAFRLAGLAFSLACVLACLALLGLSVRAACRRTRQPGRFMSELSALGAGLSAVAVIWQTLALVRF